MAVDISKVNKHLNKHRQEKEKRERGTSSSFSLKGKTEVVVYLCPPHENMQGLPWVANMYHGRELPEDFKSSKPFSKRCLRDNYEQEQNKCYACNKADKFRKKRIKKDDKYDREAKKYSARKRYITQLIDVSSLYDDSLKLVNKFKSCFLRFGEFDKCEGCHLAESCEKGMQKYYTPVTIWEDLLQHFKDEGDITEPTNSLPIRITRKGTTKLNTKYSTKPVKDRMIIPDSVISRISEKLIDLTTLDPKPVGSSEEIAKEYEDFFNLTDLTEDEEMPDCYGKYEKVKSRKRGCDDCEYNEKCAESSTSKNTKSENDEDEIKVDEIEEDIDLDEDDEDDKAEVKNLDKLRSSLKKKSRLGKLNR